MKHDGPASVKKPGFFVFVLPDNAFFCKVKRDKPDVGLSPATDLHTTMTRLFLIAALSLSAAARPAFGQCNLTAVLDSVQPVRCAGTSTGSAFVLVTGATLPLQFFADGAVAPLPGGNLTGIFSGGNHFVIAEDAVGCRDTVQFFIPSPDSLKVNVSPKNNLCNGGNAGAAKAATTGGTGSVSFIWQTCAGAAVSGAADSVNGLFEGCYRVIASDAAGCTASATFNITDPPPYQFSFLQDSVNCRGGSDGSATVIVAGGTPPYTYQWSNAQTSPTATNLSAGFHSVIVSDSFKCVAAMLTEVLEPTQLRIDGLLATSVQCAGQSNGMAEVFVVPGSGTPTYRYDWGNGQLSSKATNLSGGTYTVTVSDWNNCTATATAVVNEPPPLVVNAINVRPEICAGDCKGEATIQVSGGTSPYGFTWDTPSIPPGTSMPKNLCPGQYGVTVRDFRGCTRQEKLNILAAKPLDFRFDRIAPTCAGDSNGSILSDITGGTAPYRYRWDTGDTTANLNNIPCGKYVLTLTDAAGCVRVSTIEVLCPPPVQILTVVAKAVRCFGGSDGTLEVQAQGGTGTLKYLWSDPTAQTAPLAEGLGAGQYTVTVSDANGCSTTATMTVSQPEQLVATANGTSATCRGGNDGTATAAATGGTLGKNFSWEGGKSGPQVSGLAAGIYTVTATDATGCTATATVSIGQPADSIRISIQQVRKACFQQSNGAVLAAATGSNGGPFSFAWGNGESGPLLTGLPKTLLQLTVTDSKGCSDTLHFPSEEYDSVILNAIPVRPTCFGYSDGKGLVNFISGGVATGDTGRYELFDYTWSRPGAPNSLSLLNVPAGTYSVTATDSLGCSGTFALIIGPQEGMTIKMGKTDISCFGKNDGVAQVLSAVGKNPIISYLWANGLDDTNNPNLPPGTYTVTLTDTKGCKQTDSVSVVEPTPIRVAFESSALLCSNDQTATATATVSGGVPAYALQWNTGATEASIAQLGAGTYTLSVTDQNGCTTQGTVEIARPDSLGATAEWTDPRCFGETSGRIRLLANGGQQPYRYSINGSDFKGSSVFMGLMAGQYTLQVRDKRGCTSAVEVLLSQPPQVQVSLGLDTTILLNDSVLLSAEVNNAFGLVRYAWRSAWHDSIVCADTAECNAVWVKPFFQNTYFVTATDATGCQGKAQIRVSVEKPRGVYVPTGFSPNRDGTNELLSVYGKGAQIKRVISFQVFDRWGELLFADADFQVNDSDRGWDGQFRGQPCDPGTYIWQAEVEYWDGYREVAAGGTTLIR